MIYKNGKLHKLCPNCNILVEKGTQCTMCNWVYKEKEWTEEKVAESTR